MFMLFVFEFSILILHKLGSFKLHLETPVKNYSK